jgi:hypothetical protein
MGDCAVQGQAQVFVPYFVRNETENPSMVVFGAFRSRRAAIAALGDAEGRVQVCNHKERSVMNKDHRFHAGQTVEITGMYSHSFNSPIKGTVVKRVVDNTEHRARSAVQFALSRCPEISRRWIQLWACVPPETLSIIREMLGTPPPISYVVDLTPGAFDSHIVSLREEAARLEKNQKNGEMERREWRENPGVEKEEPVASRSIKYDTAVRQLSSHGAPLPTVLPAPRYHHSPAPLDKRVTGTTARVTADRALLQASGDQSTLSFMSDAPTFEVAQTLVAGGAADRVYASMYEPSTTGWGGECAAEYFTSLEEANAHARSGLRKQLGELDVHQREEQGMLGMLYSDEEEDGDGDSGFPEDSSMLFHRASPAGNVLHRRSRYFHEGCFVNDSSVLNAYCECKVGGATREGSSLYFGIIRNYHGEHMDGCGNPLMEEAWWVQELVVQGGREVGAGAGAGAGAGTDADASAAAAGAAAASGSARKRSKQH